VKCLVSYVLCIYAADLSVTEVWVQRLIFSYFASVTHKDSGQLPPQSLLCIIMFGLNKLYSNNEGHSLSSVCL
jgi:hypothetical protein